VGAKLPCLGNLLRVQDSDTLDFTRRRAVAGAPGGCDGMLKLGIEGKAVIGVSSVKELPKNSMERIRFSVETFRGQKFADIRTYYLDTTSDEWRPSKKGLAITPVLWGEFVQKVEELGAQMEAQGLLVEAEVEAEN